MSVLDDAIAKLQIVHEQQDYLHTEAVLDVCRLVLPVVDKLGTAFALVRSDINGNIERLAKKCATDPSKFDRIFTIIEEDVKEGTASGSSSCTKGLLWLKRAMQFMLAILDNAIKRPDDAMTKVVYDTYSTTLMQYHGWIVSNAFTLAFKFVPDRGTFLNSISEGSTTGQDVVQQVKHFVDLFRPVLDQIHKFLTDNNLDDPTKV